MTTFVCSFPRSGSSMVMQMLEAAGLRCAGEWPGFEHDGWNSLAKLDRRLLGRYDAIKWLEPHLAKRPPRPGFRCIWIDRDPFQRASSFGKFVSLVHGVDIDPLGLVKIALSMDDEREKALAVVRRVAGDSVLILRFEDILAEPLSAAGSIASFVGRGDPNEIANVVWQRPPGCLSEMLEVVQIETGSKAGGTIGYGAERKI